MGSDVESEHERMAGQTQHTATGGYEVVRFLAERGYRHVFGIPGSSMVAALYELQGSGVQFVPAIHESVVVAMADGYARVNGSAVAMLYMLPGLANGLSGLYNAWHDESPVIVIASQQATSERTPQGTTGEADLVSVAKPFTRFAHELNAGVAIRPWLERARRAALGSPAGPAFLSMTEDAFESRGPVNQIRVSQRAQPAAPELRRVISELRRAEQPLLVVGGQVRTSGGSEAIEQMAAAFEIPIVYENGFSSRLGVAPGHSHVFGNVALGGASLEQTADVVVMLGTRSAYDGHPRPVWYPQARFVAQVNADPARLEETHTVDWAACADPGAVGIALLSALGECDGVETALLDRRRERLRSLRSTKVAGRYEQMIAPARAAAAHLHDALEHGWLVDESVTASGALVEGLKSTDGRRYVGCSGASLGWGTGAAAGVALASGEPVTCVLGDGALRFGCAGLWSIQANRLPVTLVVFDNGGYGSTRFFERQYVNRLGPNRPHPDPSYFGSDMRMQGASVGQILEGFGIPCRTLSSAEDARSAIVQAWAESHRGPNAVVIPLPFELGM